METNESFFKRAWRGEEPSLRRIRENEIVLEFDGVTREEGLELSEKTQNTLKKNGFSFKVYDHLGKSPHIHVEIAGLESKSDAERRTYKENFIKKYSADPKYADFSLAGKHLIANENELHFKQKLGEQLCYGVKKLTSAVDFGINKLDPSLLEEIEEKPIRDQSNLPELKPILDYYGVTLKNNKGLCPFHDDKHPSFVSYPETQGFRCFTDSCDKRGTAYDFIMLKENCNFKTAKDKVEEILGFKEAETREEKELISIHDLKNRQIAEQNFLIKSFIPDSSLAMLVGARSSNKTWLALLFALSIANGYSLFDEYEVTKSGILFLDEENGLDTIKERIDLLKKEIKKDAVMFFYCLQNIKLDNKQDFQNLINLIDKHNIKLIIVDTFNKVFSIRDENSASEFNKINSDVIKPLKKKGVTILFLHHTRKSTKFQSDPLDSVRGTSEFVNSADAVISIDRKPTKDLFTITITKMRRSKEIPSISMQFKVSEEGDKVELLKIGEEVSKIDESQRCSEEVINLLRRCHPNELKTNAIKEKIRDLGFSDTLIQDVLRVLVEVKKIKKVKFGWYIWNKPDLPEKKQEVLA